MAEVMNQANNAAFWSINLGDVFTYILLIVGFLFTRKQLLEMIKQRKENHKREEINKTIEILMEWTNSLEEESSRARKIADLLEESQLRDINDENEINVEKCCKEAKKHIKALFAIADGDIKTIAEKNSSKIRWLLINYLNRLETIMIAWNEGAVQQDLIEKQFSYLFESSYKRATLSNFRKIIGNEAYPCIAAFEEYINKRSQEDNRPKKQLSENK